jgi:outer membrane biosynthesis protein TonB
VSTNIEKREQFINEKISKINKKIADLEIELHVLDDEIASHANQRQQYNLLSDICSSLDQLNELGASDLFWGREATGYDPELQLNRVRKVVSEFELKISAIDQSRSLIQEKIQKESLDIFHLNQDLADISEEMERIQNEYTLERKPSEIPFRPMVMPWSRQGEDEKRFRKILLIVFLFSLTLSLLLPLFRRPPEKYQEAVIPENIAKIIKRRQEELKPIEQKPQEKLSESKDKNIPSKEVKATTAETQKAREVAQTKGVLAFKNNFADLMEDTSPVKLGAQARINNGKAAQGAGNGGAYAPGTASSRSLITSQATGGSGGINTAALSRLGSGSGGGGQSITGAGVKFARVESATGAGVADDRPLSNGVGPSRTDEEIQIVFDRYKAALYRIYNRELRTDPTLRGKMVLRITIEPDGRVSACSVKSTDLASPTLSAEVVDRVLKFNFGPKQGVPKLTIIYPIDFLPAS